MNRIGTNRGRTLTAVLALAAACLAWPTATMAQITTIFEFPVPTLNSSPTGITLGPDGNLWFTEQSANKIGRLTPDGIFTEFTVPTLASAPTGITVGPDGNLWFTEKDGNKIGRVTTTGVFTAEFIIPTPASNPIGITVGPDDNLWFTEQGANKIGRITPTGVFIEFPVTTGGSGPTGITLGPDGNVWFTEQSANQIARISPTGFVTEFPPIPTPASKPTGITVGPDGNVWFTEQDGNKIGRITPAGFVTGAFIIPTTASKPTGITLGPDGNVWFTELDGNKIAQITPTGLITEFPVPTGSSGPFGITPGPPGTLWFTEQAGNKIARALFPDTTLTLTLAGSGSGAVAATPIGFSCSASCSNPVAPGTVLTLTAIPTPGHILTGWSITGCGAIPVCTVNVTQTMTVTASFEPFLSVSVNSSAFHTGDTIVISASVTNPGIPATVVDFYLGVVLPDGNTVIFFTDGGAGVGIGSLDDLHALGKEAATVALGTPFTTSLPTFASHTWTGTEPPGTYLVFFAAVTVGALADGDVDPGELRALQAVIFTFTP
jgi:streptogramin lyase